MILHIINCVVGCCRCRTGCCWCRIRGGILGIGIGGDGSGGVGVGCGVVIGIIGCFMESKRMSQGKTFVAQKGCTRGGGFLTKTTKEESRIIRIIIRRKKK